MITDFNTQIIGDRTVQNLNVNFLEKRITILFGPQDFEDKTRYEVEFNGVIWQEFSEFGDYNMFFGMEVGDSFEDFTKRQSDYLKI